MNCRAIIFGAFLNFNAISFSASAWAQSSIIDWSQLQSENMIITGDSSGQGQVLSTYPSWMQTIYTHILSWEPRVKSEKETDQNSCRLSFSSSDLQGKLSELSQFQKQKSECIYLPGADKAPGIKKLLQVLSVKFDLSDNNHFRKVVFNIPSAEQKQIHIRGLLALHDDKKPRPLVILRMGVHGNVDEFLAERFIAKAAFEDFGFNFLALENLTSHGYISQDNPVTFGGVDEGLQTYAVLQEIRNPASHLGKLISDIHLLGISLGAHGVFLTTALDEVNHHDLKSSTVFCPVVNLISTLKFHSQANGYSAFVDLWNRRRLNSIPEKIPELDHTQWWKTFFDFKPRFMPAVISYLDQHQRKPAEKTDQAMKWPLGLQAHFDKDQSFSQMNDFWPFYQNKVTPFLIVTTANDILVSEEINSDLILQKKQSGDFSQTHILQLNKGTHCGLPPDFQWNFIVSLLKTQWN